MSVEGKSDNNNPDANNKKMVADKLIGRKWVQDVNSFNFCFIQFH